MEAEVKRGTTFAMMALVACCALTHAASPRIGPFLCITEQVKGFSFDPGAKSWRVAKFRAGEKFILKHTDDKLYEIMPGTPMPMSGLWAVWTFGDDHWPKYMCDGDFSEYGYLYSNSSGVVGHFGFTLKSKRLMVDGTFGYFQVHAPGYTGVDGKRFSEGSDAPYIAIGACTSI